MNNPYYPEALYSLGEYYRVKGNFKEANLMMERLLFFYEESLVYEFKMYEEDQNEDKMCILEGKGVFNELFFKALLKFIVILLKKSLFKSGFNFTRLLLKLNPVEDPMGSLIMMDHVSLLAK